MGGELHGEQQCAPLFFCTFPEKTPKIHPDFLGNQRKLAGYFLCFVCNYLIHNKIKIFIFFLKIVVFIEFCRIFASLTTNNNNNKNKAK